MQKKIIALRMIRQCLNNKVTESEYLELYRDLQPGYNVYWNGFGDPPSLTYRASFNDIEFNRRRQTTRELIKLRLIGGNLGWIIPEDMKLFAALYCKTLNQPTIPQTVILELLKREGPLNIQQIKEFTGMLVKEITPVLHRLQEAFLVYEDQYDGEWDRSWYLFSEMFPDSNLTTYSRIEALKILLRRFAYRTVWFDHNMVKSYFKLPIKDIKIAIDSMILEGIILAYEDGYILSVDLELLQSHRIDIEQRVYAMHRNDFLVKSFEHVLKEKYNHSYPDTLYYLLIDGKWSGVVVGKFRYTPEILDVILDIPEDEKNINREKIVDAIKNLTNGIGPEKYDGKAL